MLCIWKHKNHLEWIYRCTCRSNMVKVRDKVMVRVRIKVKFRAGIHGWNVYSSQEHQSIGFHPLPRTYYRDVEGYFPEGRLGTLGTWQIVGILRVRNENGWDQGISELLDSSGSHFTVTGSLLFAPKQVKSIHNGSRLDRLKCNWVGIVLWLSVLLFFEQCKN